MADIHNGKSSCCGREGESCTTCTSGGGPLYWCDSCGKGVEEKRCPFCGLKAKRVRQDSIKR